MKLTLLLPCLATGMILSTSYEADAFGGPPGGPFSNGSYFPTDGTFSAVVRGENLSGTLQFSTTSGAGPGAQELVNDADGNPSLIDTGRGVGSTGIATIYYNGDTFRGNVQGSNNPAESTLNLNFQADSQGQGEQGFEQINATVNNTPGYTIQVSYFDSLYFNGFANCKTSNSFPNQKFEGSGEAELQYLDFTDDDLGYPFLGSESVPVSVSGVRLSNTASTFNVSDTRPPSVNHYTTEFP